MHEELKKSLDGLGITPGNYRVLMMLPLVYVAWADGKMEEVEIARIDDIARQKLYLELSGLEMLDQWLRKPPDEKYFQEGMKSLFLLAQTEEGDPLIHADELGDLLNHAEAIARATANEMDVATAVTPEEEDALHEIAEVLQLDNGVSWRELLDELDAGPKSILAGRRAPK